MKKVIFYFTLLTLVAFYSCSSETSQKEQPAKQMAQQKKTKPKAKATPVPEALPAMDKLRKLNRSSHYTIGSINNQPIKKPKQTINIQGDKIAITGWAVDRESKKLAGGIYIEIGGQFFPANYKKARPDVAKHLNNSNYLRSGYDFVIPTSKIAKGLHPVKIHILSNDKSAVFEPSKNQDIKIDVK